MSGRNWGVAVACLIAVPLALAWAAIALVGGGLVCADEAAHCSGVLWPLLAGLALIAAGTTVLGWIINRGINLIARRR